jgi:ABC-2 type transport system ATP-binding protein
MHQLLFPNSINMEQVIQINSVSKNFDSVIAIDDLSLTINRGEMFGLVGPDGAGKTTTIRLLCGIYTPTKGNILLLGNDTIKDSAKIKNKIGYLSQRFSLYRDLSVEENIQFFAEIHGVKKYKERLEELLEFTRLTPFRKRFAEYLSGGMKQKLALACTLIHTPEIIFLDEPTTGVDPVSRRDFWKILSNLLKSNITIILTTPYLDEAERCTRVGLINNGKIMNVDTPQNLKGLLNCNVIEIIPSEVRRASKILSESNLFQDIQAFGDRINIVSQDNNKDMKEIENLLLQNKISITGRRIINPSLENIFIALITKKCDIINKGEK